MRNKLITISLIVLGLAAGAQAQSRRDASPCDAIKGKTYLAWSAGKFDENPDAAGASRMVVAADGSGSTRSFMSYRPTDANGVHQLLTFTCNKINAAPADKQYLLGKAYLAFKSSGGDAGVVYITSYDGGAKVWAESGVPGRPMKGWMLLLPPAPPVADNLVK